MKLQKHNISSQNKPKMTSIGDYWDEKTTREIFDLLHEYKDLFPASVTKLKGIKGDIGEMNIVLKLDAQPLKHSSYRLKPRVKEKVKKYIDKMLEARLIFSVSEAD